MQEFAAQRDHSLLMVRLIDYPALAGYTHSCSVLLLYKWLHGPWLEIIIGMHGTKFW